MVTFEHRLPPVFGAEQGTDVTFAGESPVAIGAVIWTDGRDSNGGFGLHGMMLSSNHSPPRAA